MKSAADAPSDTQVRLLAAYPSLADLPELLCELLAQRLGASRETVSRALKVFEGSGWIRLRRGTVEVLQPQALRAAAGGNPGSVTAVTEGRPARQ